MNALTIRKPRAGREATASDISKAISDTRTTLAVVQALRAELRAELPGLILDAPAYHQTHKRADDADREIIRLHEVERLLEAQLPSAVKAERLADFNLERARIEREGQRRAATWRRRYEAAAADLAAVVKEMEDDRQAVRRLKDEACELDQISLWPAEYALRRDDVRAYQSIADQLVLPAWDMKAARLWPAR